MKQSCRLFWIRRPHTTLVLPFFVVTLIVGDASNGQVSHDNSDYTVVYTETDHSLVRTFDIRNVRRGESRIVSVLFSNQTNSEIRFEAVEIGCRCLSAKVTNEPLGPGLHTRMDFAFDVLDNPKSKTQVLQVRLPISFSKRVVLQFRITFSDLLVFPDDQYMHTSVVQDRSVAKEESFIIPLVRSSDLARETISISPSKELKFIDFDIYNKDSKLFLRGKFRTSHLRKGQTKGTISIASDNSESQSTIDLTIEGVDRYGIFPDVLSLTDSGGDDQVMTGNAIMRVRGQKSAVKIGKVSCEFPDGTHLKVNKTPLAGGIYRLQFESEESDNAKLREFSEVIITIKHDGKTIARIQKYRLL